jgi:NADH-quinone oxidoreductase subunit F
MTDIKLQQLQSALEGLGAKSRSDLLPALHAAQEIYGFISDATAAEIATALKIPLSEVHGVIEFYALFYNKPVGKTVLHVCNDPVCSIAGADGIFKRMTQKVTLSFEVAGKTADVTVERAPCLGLCEHAPALHVQDTADAQVDPETWGDLVTEAKKHPNTYRGGDIAILTANCGCDRIIWLEEYEQNGGYQSLRTALTMAPTNVVAEIKKSGLVGRGGAAFPTGVKWEAVANTAADLKYVVCNGDEAEPGAFKDRVMMENDPHRILEGLIIAAYAVGASKGYFYIRGEYTYPFEVVSQAVEEAQRTGYLGENILGSGFNFDIEIRRGAGAYICGEETALFESIEGKRGFPRVKPPFPVTNGLFGKPTVINNVETLCNVPTIISAGADAYRQLGTEKSPGSKLFCVSGDVEKPGLYEVAFGTPFRHLLEDLAGGVRGGKKLQAALFGGAAGTFGTSEALDAPLSFEGLREIGLSLGAGVITVFDESRDMGDIVLRLARFFAEESCGKCYPCQLGTQRQYEIVQRAAAGAALPGDAALLRDIDQVMTDASLCGLGQTAGMAVRSAMSLWPERYEPPA